MRRKKQALSVEKTAQILKRGSFGVLALSGEEGYPYAVPLSYVYDGDAIYFHSAKSGHKLDALRRSGKASFCVVDRDCVVPEAFTTWYASAIVFGRIAQVEDEDEKRCAMQALALKYSPNEPPAARAAEIDRGWKALCVLKLSIEHLTGKQAIELVKNQPRQDT